MTSDAGEANLIYIQEIIKFIGERSGNSEPGVNDVTEGLAVLVGTLLSDDALWIYVQVARRTTVFELDGAGR